MFKKIIRAYFDKKPLMYGIALSLLKKAYPIFLDYPIDPKARYGYGKPPHKLLYDIINLQKDNYKELLRYFLTLREFLLKIPTTENPALPHAPSWHNGYFSGGLDIVSLYGLLCKNNPRYLLEIGSGYSTKIARQAIKDNNLKTIIISVDPNPRSEIDLICDEVIRKPVEKIDLSIFNKLDENDILFVDNSHRVFMNSDACIIFLDILPTLKKGVYVEVHDIFLPYDYPPEWISNHYSEQYLLAMYLLAEGNKVEIVLPNVFISRDQELNSILSPLWNDGKLQGIKTYGDSFWMKIN